MIAILTQQAATEPPSGGTLAAYVALAVSILTPLAAGLKAWSDRKTRRERNAAALQAEAQGGVIATGSPLEWRTTDHQALLDERTFSRELRDRADKAEAEARSANQRADETRRERDNDREMLNDLRREFDQLVAKIASCEAGHFCPVADALTRDPRTGETG